MEKRLNEIFSNVNNWLKFAEEKNAVILSLNGAVLIGGISYLKDAQQSAKMAITYGVIPLFGIATVILLVSFVPFVYDWLAKMCKPKDPPIEKSNLIYYTHIRKLKHDTYLKYLYQADTGSAPQVLPKLELDLAEEITINSGIAYWKYKFFTFGFFADFLGIITAFVLFWVYY